jgi:hypothetical protein
MIHDYQQHWLQISATGTTLEPEKCYFQDRFWGEGGVHDV